MAEPTMAELYRSYAAKEQAYAAEATLGTVKAIHLASTRKWMTLAERSESYTKPT